MNISQRHKILRLVEKKINRGKFSTWKNKDFEDLSFAIHQETKVLISVATLKRIFNKVKTSESYTPQENTLQALIAYSGYKTSSSKSSSLIIIIVAFVIISIVATWIFISSTNKNNQTSKSDGLLTLRKTEGKSPTTAFFEVSIPEINEPVFLNFGDSTISDPLTSKNKVLTHFYPYPGHFKAILQTKSQEISAPVHVLAETNGWQVLSHYYDEDVLPERYYPISIANNIADGYFHTSSRNLSKAGIDTSGIVVVRLDNFKRTNVSGDNFIYKSHVKNTDFWPGIRCFSIYVSITGTNGMIQFKFVGEGCSTYSEYILSEKSKEGSNEDLSEFVVNTHEWFSVNIKNENKNVALSINDSIVFNDNYEVSIGDIVGTSVIFHGNGKVDYIHLSSVENEHIFYEDFNE